MPKLTIIITSTRPGRVGLPVGQWFERVARENGKFDVTVADLKEIDLPMMDEPNHPRLKQYTHEHTRDWAALIEASDAFVFITPEYNFSINAPLKNALDYVYDEWAYKPVGLVTYGGISGGLRAGQMVRSVAANLRMFPLHECVIIHWVGKSINDEGEFEASPAVEKSVHTMLDEMARIEPGFRLIRKS